MFKSLKKLFLILLIFILLVSLTSSVDARENYIDYFISQGILKGDGQGNYFLDRTITEKEAVAFLLRTYQDKSAEPQEIKDVRTIDRSILIGKQSLSPSCYAKWIFVFADILPYDYQMYSMNYSDVVRGQCTGRETIWQYHTLNYDENARYLCQLWNITLPNSTSLTRGQFLELLYNIEIKNEKVVPKPAFLKQFNLYVDNDISFYEKLSFYDDLTFIPVIHQSKIISYKIFYTRNMGYGVFPQSSGSRTVFIELKNASGATWLDTKVIKINADASNIYRTLMHEIGHVITEKFTSSFSVTFNEEGSVFEEIYEVSNHFNKSEMLADAYALFTAICGDREKLDTLKVNCPLTYQFMIDNFNFR